MQDTWRIRIDTGGTFTDCLALDPEGGVHRAKVLSSSSLRGSVAEVISPGKIRAVQKWGAVSDLIAGFTFRFLETGSAPARVTSFDAETSVIELDRDPGAVTGACFEVLSPEEAPVLAARLVTGTPAGRALPPMDLRLATTWGTNALLTRRGAPTALFITRGFGDLLLIGDQRRPDLFALNPGRPDPFYSAVVEVPERLDAEGRVLAPLDLPAMDPEIKRLVGQGVRSAAVALMHSYQNPEHERALAARLLDHGFKHVSVSSDLAGFIKILPRAETAAADAYLAPVVGAYLDRVAGPTGHGRMLVMTSAGGLISPGSYRAKDSLLSGPAGGVVGAAGAGRDSGFSKVIAFDMGGTSTDVSRYHGKYEYLFEHTVGDARLVAPALAIETVAAGGGSVCGFDGIGLCVGPQSAGADPGPACYGAGGPLTLTDVNLLLGRLDPSRFEIPIDPGAARARLDEILLQVARAAGEKPRAKDALEGFLDIADERMADAIRRVSLRRGYDPGDYALVAFGGAGAQHACGVAAKLGMDTIIVPAEAGLLSARGLDRAVLERFAERQVLKPLAGIQPRLDRLIRDLAVKAQQNLALDGVEPQEIEIRRAILNMRYTGQDMSLDVEYEPGLDIKQAFETRYQNVFGHLPPEREIEVESARVVASTRPEPGELQKTRPEQYQAEPAGSARACFGGTWSEVPVFDRVALLPGAYVRGPALVFERHSAAVVQPGWSLFVDRASALILVRESKEKSADKTRPEAVMVELFSHRFTTIASEMGEMLKKTALSTNVKERLDFSCAVLDPEGNLVVNAPHIPVHLGAMGLCVRAAAKAVRMRPGDVVVTNHPGFGGSHLPDVTVITPVFLDDRLIGYAANRAHHAEIGGERPGSMPPGADSLAREGVVIAPMRLVDQGRPRYDEIARVLASGPYPSRAVQDNLADLRAAVAANRHGEQALASLAREHGAGTVLHFMELLKAGSEAKIRRALDAIPDGDYRALERLDDGTPLKACLTISGDLAVVDFTGSGPVHPGNLNATRAVVMSVVMYVMRLLLAEEMPLNEGVRRAVKVNIPRGILDPGFPDDPSKAPAVVGGNVETSQRLTDTLLKALGLVACSQGTMNNLLFGDDTFSYYETICGGCGAGPGFDGASAVHSHMTNTRITDPEIVERRYPVRVDRFAVRRGSGGPGRWRGGDGAVRELTFLKPMSVSILSQHRVQGPYGLDGGGPGKPGSQCVLKPDGRKLSLNSIDSFEADPGDRLIIKTPGGGGYGERK